MKTLVTGADLSRRDVLRTTLAGAGLLALGPFGRWLPEARGAPMALKRLVVVNLFGGCDTTNLFIPVSLGDYYSQRAQTIGGSLVDISIPEAAALPIDTGPAATTAYRFHPALPKIAARWRAGQVAAIHRVGYPNPNLSHFESEDIFSYGVRNGFGPLGLPASGWIARYAERHAPTPLGAVGLGVGRRLDFVGGAANPLLVSSLGNFRINGTASNSSNARLHRTQHAKNLLARYQGTGLPAESKAALDQAYALTNQVQSAIAAYTTQVTWPTSSIGQRLRDVAVLIEGGFETRIFYTGFGGFDTHSDQGQGTGQQANLFTALDDAVGALADDLQNRGIWDDVVVLVITEFGRRNYVNGSSGTDHGHAFTALAIGGAVQGGVHGPHLRNADLKGEYPTYAVDFRSVYKDLITRHLGNDADPLFPEKLPIEHPLQLV